jgi:hypothetical protein
MKNHMFTFGSCLLLTFLLGGAGTFVLLAQSEATEISGRVTDPQSNAVVNARVTLDDTRTGSMRETSTDAAQSPPALPGFASSVSCRSNGCGRQLHDRQWLYRPDNRSAGGCRPKRAIRTSDRCESAVVRQPVVDVPVPAAAIEGHWMLKRIAPEPTKQMSL